MATAILLVPTSAADSIAGGNMYTASPYQWWSPTDYTATGSADFGECLQAAGDGKYLTSNGSSPVGVGVWRFVDAAAIPVGATINSVQVAVKMDVVHMSFASASLLGLVWPMIEDPGYILTPLVGTDSFDFTGSGTYYTAVMTTVPNTGNPWATTDLYGHVVFDWATENGTHGWWFMGMGIDFPWTGGPPNTFSIDYIAMIVDYTSTTPSVWYYNPNTDHYQYASSDPGAPWTVVPSMPAPIVTAVSPSSGTHSGGTPVTITGNYFGD
jgi:hypothetical protein